MLTHTSVEYLLYYNGSVKYFHTYLTHLFQISILTFIYYNRNFASTEFYISFKKSVRIMLNTIR